MTQASHLRVRVVEADEVRVDLTLRAATAAFLGELLPPEVAERLPARGIDVHEIEARVRQDDFAPGELFTLTEGTKEVRVWLE